MDNNTFQTLNAINLGDSVKEKMGLKYLSWAYGWEKMLTLYPDASMQIHERTVQVNEVYNYDNKTVTNSYTTEIPYFTDGKTCWVKVSVTINGKTYTEMLAVMDNKMNAVRLEAVTSVQVNKAIQRCFVKALARHGLGLYIFRGEDLPTSEKEEIENTINDAFQEAESNTLPLSNLSFEELRTDVCNTYSKLLEANLPAAIINAMNNYIAKKHPSGYRVSTLTEEHRGICERIKQYLKVVKRFLGE